MPAATRRTTPKKAVVFDLDALEREEKREPFTFRFDGKTYELPADLDMRILATLDSGDIIGALEKMLGEDQWKRMVAAKRVFGLTEFMALLDAYGKHIGVSMGESSASTGSSNGTAKRSRPTSRGTTKLR